LDGVPLADLAQQHGTPLYVYSRATIQRQLRQLQAALAAAVDRYAVYFAVKANRCLGVLQAVCAVPGVGADACSPREVDLARQAGFAPAQISFNAGMLSDRDLAAVAGAGVHCTLDSFSALRRYGALVPAGTPVGLRFNPGVRVGYGSDTRAAYGNAKFGFEPEECRQALHVAETAGLVVDSVHTHVGWGLPEAAAGEIERAFMRLAAVAKQIPRLATVNIGGGLGGRFRAADHPLELSTWSALIRQHLTRLGVAVACEPGTFVAAPAGVLLVEVNTVEERRGKRWIGVDAGYAINPCPALYNIPIEIVPLRQPLAEPVQACHVAGHINESYDIWAHDYPLPDVREGDLLALLPAGAYGASMASDHCLRGRVQEIVV
jgi:diaminopimelate decarboxylase